MKMCQNHWDALKKAINERGLGDLVTDAEGLKKVITDELEDRPKTRKNFDPLFAANNMIMCNALEVGGIYLMGQDENGNEYCPVCEAEKHNQHGWIDKAADGAVNTAKALPEA